MKAKQLDKGIDHSWMKVLRIIYPEMKTENYRTVGALQYEVINIV
jgi:hypothetical protein